MVTNKSPEGHSFINGFGGIGAVLRYEINLEEFDTAETFGKVKVITKDDFDRIKKGTGGTVT